MLLPLKEGRTIHSGDRIAAISPGASAVPVEDHLLVAECRSGDLRLFNPTAAFIWRRLEERLSESSIARAVARDFGIDHAVALADVAATIDAWGAAGLATLEGHPARRAPRVKRRTETAARDAGRRQYRIGERPFTVRFRLASDAGIDETRFHERVTAILAPLERASRPPGPEIELRIDESHVGAYGPFCREILERLFGPFDWLFTLHAAAIAREGGAIALCASQGGGKSTLTAHLAARGWRYFSDDLAIIDPRGPAVLPLPVALGVKEGSRSLLEGTYPALRTAPIHRYGRKAARYLAMRHPATAPAALAAIVFSRYEAGAAFEMRRVGPAEAARCVMEAGVVFSPAVRPRMLEWMGRLLQCTPCHQMRYSDLREAETALRTIS